MKNNKTITFVASLPPIQSAILLDGQGDGARIKLDISREYMDAILELHTLSDESFKVTVEKGDNGTT